MYRKGPNAVCWDPTECSMLFNANKSKCLFFSARHTSRAVYEKLLPFVIGSNKIEYVSKRSHLGHVIILS